MRKSNGKRPVNKTDGGKRRAKKQMAKSRRADKKKEIKETKVFAPIYLDGPGYEDEDDYDLVEDFFDGFCDFDDDF